MESPGKDMWQFQAQLGRRLIQWAGFSVGSGAVMSLIGDRVWRGIGSQFVAWGLIDGLIGWAGLRSARTKAAEPEAHTRSGQASAQRSLSRVLWINTGLDGAYITGGLGLALTRGRKDALMRGVGVGIALQGAFLLAFDLLHALALRSDSAAGTGDTHP